RADGKVVAWGKNDGGQTNVPAGLSNVVAIVARSSCNLAVKDDGTMVGWGSCPVNPPALTNALVASLGDAHGIALIGSRAPFIIEPPLGGTVFLRQRTYLHARATVQGPASYQWRFND